MDIQETGRRLGRYVWTERRVFEMLGRWVPVVPEADVKIRLASDSYKHAWHAELWRERLPQLSGTDAESLVVAESDEWARFVNAVAEPGPPDHTIETLVGVYRVLLPRKIAAYRAHLEQTSPITDGPVIRALRLVLRDELDDWRDGELLVQSLLRSDEHVERAARRQDELERLVVRAEIAGGSATV